MAGCFLGFNFQTEDRLATLQSDVERPATALAEGEIGDPGYHQQFSPARKKLLEAGGAVQEWNFAPREKV